MQDTDAAINPSTEILIAENIKALRDAQKLLERMEDRTYTKVEAPTFFEQCRRAVAPLPRLLSMLSDGCQKRQSGL